VARRVVPGGEPAGLRRSTTVPSSPFRQASDETTTADVETAAPDDAEEPVDPSTQDDPAAMISAAGSAIPTTPVITRDRSAPLACLPIPG
jgi:hypothetical protein